MSGAALPLPLHDPMTSLGITLHSFILLSITNSMQRYTIFFIIVNAVHVSGGFSARHQELKNCTHSIGYMPSLLAATTSGSSKQALHKEYCMTLHLVGYT